MGGEKRNSFKGGTEGEARSLQRTNPPMSHITQSVDTRSTTMERVKIRDNPKELLYIFL